MKYIDSSVTCLMFDALQKQLWVRSTYEIYWLQCHMFNVWNICDWDQLMKYIDSSDTRLMLFNETKIVSDQLMKYIDRCHMFNVWTMWLINKWNILTPVSHVYNCEWSINEIYWQVGSPAYLGCSLVHRGNRTVRTITFVHCKNNFIYLCPPGKQNNENNYIRAL